MPLASHARFPAHRPPRRLTGRALLGALAAVAVAAPASAITPGQVIKPGPKTPAAATAAIKSGKTVVMAFVVPGAADDDAVAAAIARLRRSTTAARNVQFLVYQVTSKPRFGDLPEVLGIEGTPTVAVIRADDKLQNLWLGLVDDTLIAQGISSARARSAYVPDPKPTPKPTPKPSTTTPAPAATAKGSPAGIALAKQVNLAYGKVPGVLQTWTQLRSGAKTTVRVSTGLQVGRITGSVARISVASQPSTTAVASSAGRFARADGESCWRADASVRTALGSEFLPLANARFSAPMRTGGVLRMQVSGVAGVHEYRINARTKLVERIITMKELGVPRGTVTTVRSLAAAPFFPEATPRCKTG